MLRLDDDDDDADLAAALLQQACDGLLKALKQHELYPDTIDDQDRDRYPRLSPTPYHANLLPSPGALCAARAAPPEADDGRGRRR
jgi:hypothetical protein